MCMADDAEACTFWNSTWRRARKMYKCGECGRTILYGEHYLYMAWLFDGDFSTSRMCAHCHVAAEWLMKNCGGWLAWGIREDVQEHVDEYAYLGWRYLAGLGRLTIGMRRKWKIQHGMRTGELMKLPKLPPTIDERTAQPA